KTRENTTLIRLAGKYKDVQELQNLIIKEKNGIQIRLSDVAEVRDTQKEVEKVARNNQENAILIQILKQSDANAVAVSGLIQRAVRESETDYAAMHVELTIAYVTCEFTLTAAYNVIFDIFLAIFLVAAVMLLFLHSLRNALIVMVTIPASLIATFIGI